MFNEKRKIVLISSVLILFLSGFLYLYKNCFDVICFYFAIFAGVGIFLGAIDYLKFKFVKFIQIGILVVFIIWSILFFVMLILMASGRIGHPS